MMKLLLLTQLLTLALPGCKSPKERRDEVLSKVEQALRYGQTDAAMQILDRATLKAPRCLEFWSRSFDLRVTLGRCDDARSMLPAIAADQHIRLLHARFALRCSGDIEALGRAWKDGYGRHPDLLRAMKRYEVRGWEDAHAFAKLLVRVRDEGDGKTLRTWLRTMPEPSWYLESYLDVAGLLPALHRARDPKR